MTFDPKKPVGTVASEPDADGWTTVELNENGVSWLASERPDVLRNLSLGYPRRFPGLISSILGYRKPRCANCGSNYGTGAYPSCLARPFIPMVSLVPDPCSHHIWRIPTPFKFFFTVRPHWTIPFKPIPFLNTDV